MRKLETVPGAEAAITESGEWMNVRMAVGGRLVIPFDVHKADWQRYGKVRELEAMLARQAATLLDEYGDAREGRAR